MALSPTSSLPTREQELAYKPTWSRSCKNHSLARVFYFLTSSGNKQRRGLSREKKSKEPFATFSLFRDHTQKWRVQVASTLISLATFFIFHFLMHIHMRKRNTDLFFDFTLTRMKRIRVVWCDIVVVETIARPEKMITKTNLNVFPPFRFIISWFMKRTRLVQTCALILVPIK